MNALMVENSIKAENRITFYKQLTIDPRDGWEYI